MTNRSMPPGIIIPELAYPDVETAADWLCDVLGFTKRLIIGKHRIQLVLDGESIVATTAPNGNALNTADHAIMVRVLDVASIIAMLKSSARMSSILQPTTLTESVNKA